MATDTPEPAEAEDSPDCEVMAAVDDDGSSREYVIADVSRDDAWISVEDEEALALPSWR